MPAAYTVSRGNPIFYDMNRRHVGLLGTGRENDKHDPYQPRHCWPWKVGASYAIDM
jgi:hypothetical protein